MFTRAVLLVGVLQWSAITAVLIFKTKEIGKSNNFTCPADLKKNYTKTYKFFKSLNFGSDLLLTPDARIKQYGHTLVMSNLDFRDSGIYSCSVYDQNDNKIEHHSLGILSILPARKFIFKITEPENQTSIVDEDVSFEFRCEYSKPSTELIWERRLLSLNGSVKEADRIPRDKITVLTDSSKSVEVYRIKRVSLKDSGAYRCQVLEKGTLRSTDARILQVKHVCYDGDTAYNPGQTFISSDCNHCKCILDISGRIGLACRELCPLVNIICAPGEVTKQWSEQIPESTCSCPRWKCVKKADEFCEVLGGRHKIGERFIPKDCHGSCRCYSQRSFGCVSLCPPHGIYCRPGTRKIRTVRPIYGSNCTCPSWECVKVKSKWHPWSDWTECDAKCGGGLRYRFRTCMRTERCLGPSTETEVCNKAPCSPSYAVAPCGALRINSVKDGDIWPRCDDQGYFEPLQCDPSTSQCWCVDKWGKVEPGSRRISHKPQCGLNHRNVIQGYSRP